MDYTSVLSN